MRSTRTGRGSGSGRARGQGSVVGDSVLRHCEGKVLRTTPGRSPCGHLRASLNAAASWVVTACSLQASTSTMPEAGCRRVGVWAIQAAAAPGSPPEGGGATLAIGREDGSGMAYTRITTDPQQMGGQPCIRGLRIPVATVVAMVADRMSVDEIVAAYPDLEPEDVVEALRYAAGAVRELELPLRTPA